MLRRRRRVSAQCPSYSNTPEDQIHVLSCISPSRCSLRTSLLLELEVWLNSYDTFSRAPPLPDAPSEPPSCLSWRCGSTPMTLSLRLSPSFFLFYTLGSNTLVDLVWILLCSLMPPSTLLHWPNLKLGGPASYAALVAAKWFTFNMSTLSPSPPVVQVAAGFATLYPNCGTLYTPYGLTAIAAFMTPKLSTFSMGFPSYALAFNLSFKLVLDLFHRRIPLISPFLIASYSRNPRPF